MTERRELNALLLRVLEDNPKLKRRQETGAKFSLRKVGKCLKLVAVASGTLFTVFDLQEQNSKVVAHRERPFHENGFFQSHGQKDYKAVYKDIAAPNFDRVVND